MSLQTQTQTTNLNWLHMHTEMATTSSHPAKKMAITAALLIMITAACCILLSKSLIFPMLILLPLFVLSLTSNRRNNTTPPGPFSLPIFGNWLQVGNDLNHRFLAAMANKYGSPFLLKLGSRNLVVVSDPKLASDVLHTQGVEFGSRPRNVVFDIFTGNGQDMVFTVYGDHWRRMRRIMTLPFFTNKVVHQYKDMWQQEMDLVLADLHSNSAAHDEGLVVRRRLQLMLYNIMYRMMFDAGFTSVTDPLFLQATRFNSERSRLSQSFEYNYGDYIPVLRPFLKGYLNRCRDLQGRRLAFFQDNYVQKRRELMAINGDGHIPKCAMDHILEAERNGELTAENVIYIVENINVAAIETTLWSMEWAIAELVNHPDVQEKLRREIYDVLRDEPVTEESLQRLPYLQAVVKETLRLHTPIPLLVPHMNLEEAKLGGYRIPEGTKVVVNAWWMANNPEWWERPEEFRPERFVDEEEGRGVDAVVGGKVDFRFMPFGVGRRSCPGIILAMPILGLIVGKLVREFEMRSPPGMEKIDVAEKGGQFSLQIANHSVVAFKPIKK